MPLHEILHACYMTLKIWEVLHVMACNLDVITCNYMHYMSLHATEDANVGGRRPAATGVITREFASESESQELTFGGQESSPPPTLRRPGGPGDGLTVTLIPAARCWSLNHTRPGWPPVLARAPALTLKPQGLPATSLCQAEAIGRWVRLPRPPAGRPQSLPGPESGVPPWPEFDLEDFFSINGRQGNCGVLEDFLLRMERAKLFIHGLILLRHAAEFHAAATWSITACVSVQRSVGFHALISIEKSSRILQISCRSWYWPWYCSQVCSNI